jgi:lipopolysaccharide biosynthesis glycosyltransferase
MPERSPGESVEVVCAVDDRYAMQLGVTIKSLVHTFGTSGVLPRSRFGRLNIHVIDYGLSAESRARLEACARCEPPKMIALTFVAPIIRSEMMETYAALQSFAARLFPQHVYLMPPAMFATFSIQDFLPDVARAIFLDADLLVRSDIRELWAINTSGHLVSAVAEYNDDLLGEGSVLSWPLRLAVRLCLRDLMLFQIGLSHTTFNTGVLILELDLIRRREPELTRRLLDKARELMTSHQGQLVFFSDQDMISTYLRDRINPLPTEWNFHDFLPRLLLRYSDYRRAIKQSKIMHFNGPPRPWEFYGRWRPFRKAWYTYLDRTPWAGWRPSLRRARVPRGRGHPVRTLVGGLMLVGGRFRNHFFAQQDAPESNA